MDLQVTFPSHIVDRFQEVAKLIDYPDWRYAAAELLVHVRHLMPLHSLADAIALNRAVGLGSGNQTTVTLPTRFGPYLEELLERVRTIIPDADQADLFLAIAQRGDQYVQILRIYRFLCTLEGEQDPTPFFKASRELLN